MKEVEAKKYQIKFIEPYCSDQEKIEFGVDLAVQTEGVFCVARNRYPWGI
jgi:hypothetical protein